jgi:hypothetical protein
MQIKDSYSQQRRKESGRGLIGTVIRLGFFIAVIAVLAQSLEVLYRFYDLKNQLAYLTRAAELEPDLELRKKVLALTKRARIECTEQDIVLDRSGELVRLELRYRHPIGIPLASTRWEVWAVPLHLSVERKSVPDSQSVKARLAE